MTSRPSSPDKSASSGSWSRASGATYSHSVERDVRRVADDQVDLAVQFGQGVQRVALAAGDAGARDVACGAHASASSSQLHGVHARARAPPGRGPARWRPSRCTGRRPAARRRPWRARASMAQPTTDLGLRPGHEHPGPDLEFQVAEVGPAGDVLERLAGLAAGDRRPVAGVEVARPARCAARPARRRARTRRAPPRRCAARARRPRPAAGWPGPPREQQVQLRPSRCTASVVHAVVVRLRAAASRPCRRRRRPGSRRPARRRAPGPGCTP